MNSDTPEKKRLYAEVLAALDKIRPYLEADGGDVKIVEISDDNVVMIELLGACGSCPMSTMTLKAGVEEAVKREVPEIKSVEAINITPLEFL
jgi:Fe-S cluster biogenesis protein NfuA